MRRLVLAILAFAGAVTGGTTPAAGVAGFGDVEAGRFYTAAVQWMVDGEMTNGTSSTCFSPDAFVSRGQAAAFIWRMEGRPLGSPPHGFVDVVAPWQQEAVSWMRAEGITTGTSPTTYSPDRLITRGELAVMLHRLAGTPSAGPSAFVDVVELWQIEPVGWLLSEGITTGTSPTTFSPAEDVTRGQLAAFLHRHQGSPEVEIDDHEPICPDFLGPIAAHPDITGSVGFRLSPDEKDVTGFILFLDVESYGCPDLEVVVSSEGLVQELSDPDVSFVGSSFAYFSPTQSWTGTVIGDIASGTVGGRLPVASGETCEWGPLDWTAVRI